LKPSSILSFYDRQQRLFRCLRGTVQAVEPSADCILFGSLARGDARMKTEQHCLLNFEQSL
jgi:predicted nucleotidyltransferase